MLFNSYIFVLFFLPLVIFGYFTLNHYHWNRTAKAFLLGMSLWFYAYFNFFYFFLMLGSICFNFAIYKSFPRCKHHSTQKALLVVAIIFNIGALFYFKYFNFFVANINALFGSSFIVEKILLPLGISFFTFQQVSFVIDAYRAEIPDYNFVDYACFVSFFPQLVAGPIVTHDELVPQFADPCKKRFNWDNFAQGLYCFSLGLAKKVLIADVIGNVANWGYANIGALNSLSAIIVTLSYTIQIYFDFSGYSDMAIGMAKMMNIDLPINFNSPYKALTINQFWDRWHMTLTRFFTKYIYIPLGGNRRGVARTYLNIMTVYLISGIWHGANWTFIVWGICHGILCVLSRFFKKQLEKLPSVLNWLLTFGAVNLLWVFFRADSLSDAFSMIAHLFSFNFGAISSELVNAVLTAEWTFVISQVSILSQFKLVFLLAYLIVPIAIALCAKTAPQKMRELNPGICPTLITAVLLVWCILSFAGVSTFLYFNF